jgi:uncharacterized protein (TIGR02145 family)
MKKLIFFPFIFLIIFSCSKKETTPTIIPPVVTSIITIGTQKWMDKNLEVATYRNGDIIPQVTDPTIWAALKTGAWCFYNNDVAKGAKYGKLYNWYAVIDSRGLAPKGWHIPSDAEWTNLNIFLGDEAGGKLKELGTLNWQYPNRQATNYSGFSALPGGFRDYDGKFSIVGSYGYWWSATELSSSSAMMRSLSYFDGALFRSSSLKHFGFSVRCLKD